MKIIMVAGKPKTGKSTSVSKDFHDWLVNQGATEIHRARKGPIEYEGVFDYKGKTIALHSPGDLYQLIVFALVRYAHVDVLVLTGNITVTSIVKLVGQIKANKNHCVIPKKSATNQDNARACKDIIAAL